ncbi:JAB domain-containing protein [Bacteroides sp. 51]|uniref:JAB domain-containing protein n=1 Tax=Bacteroides sp. 51 TaxID=2302938 RepID=UPI0013D241EA|nr:JAB domain-containing protein [Bacteroides sp. 51]NDV83383.1 hypothetical protein [Bacteroides sp. 51]
MNIEEKTIKDTFSPTLSPNSTQLQIDWSSPVEHASTLEVDESLTKIYKESGYNIAITEDSITYCERLLSEQGFLTFMGDKLTGSAKIESSSDVAFLFKNLESAATENAFAVLIKEDGTYSVLYLSTGATNYTPVDTKLVVTAAHELSASKVYVVHNHPSGSLQPSIADYNLHNALSKSFIGTNIELEDSVIINLDSGQYTVFDDTDCTILLKNDPLGKIIEPKVYQFDRQQLYVPSTEKYKIMNSEDIAKFLSIQKRGLVPKIQMLVLGQDNTINRYVALDPNLNIDELLSKIIYEVGKHGESVIIASNGSMSKIDSRFIQSTLKKTGINLLDVITIKQDENILSNYVSYFNDGVFEPTTKYNPTELKESSLLSGKLINENISIYRNRNFSDSNLATDENYKSPIKENVMKDQRKLLHNCLHNEIPAIVFQGTDGCSIEILEAAMKIYEKNGCSKEFLYDFKLLIADFKAYQIENSAEVKLPKLTESEKMQVQEDMLDVSKFPDEMKDFEKKLKESGFTIDDSEMVIDKTYRIAKSPNFNEIMGKKSDYVFSIVQEIKTSSLHFNIYSNDGKYPEAPGDYMSFKTCFTDAMSTSKVTSKNIDDTIILPAATQDLKDSPLLPIEKDIKTVNEIIKEVDKNPGLYSDRWDDTNTLKIDNEKLRTNEKELNNIFQKYGGSQDIERFGQAFRQTDAKTLINTGIASKLNELPYIKNNPLDVTNIKTPLQAVLGELEKVNLTEKIEYEQHESLIMKAEMQSDLSLSNKQVESMKKHDEKLQNGIMEIERRKEILDNSLLKYTIKENIASYEGEIAIYQSSLKNLPNTINLKKQEDEFAGIFHNDEYYQQLFQPSRHFLNKEIETLSRKRDQLKHSVDNLNYKNIQIASTGSKSLTAEVNSKDKVERYLIKDHYNDKIDPLNVKDVDLRKQSPDALKKLLSGAKVELKNLQGTTNLYNLTKSPTGWDLQIGKQTFATIASGIEM